MWSDVFVVSFMILSTVIMVWSYKVLPSEGWQMLASVPVTKSGESWLGMNYTYYGLLISFSLIIAILILAILLGSLGMSLNSIMLLISFVLIIFIPAARAMAKLVEKKHYTFSVGGASFLAIILLPPVLWGISSMSEWYIGSPLPLLPILAAFAISYCIGEGFGRMACISFGCCYGKPLSQVPEKFKKLIGRYRFVFWGTTKKVAYEGKLEGEPLVPIQSITSIILVGAGSIGMILYFRALFVESFLFTILVAQCWRFFSEMFRADFRGTGRWSAYQKMALLSAVYVLIISSFQSPEKEVHFNILGSITAMWDPAFILFLEFLFAAIFIYTGRSKVTGSEITFYVIDKNT